MRKIIMIIMALMLLAMPVSAGYLEAADRAGDEPAAAELREYVYESGAAQDVKAEMRRIFLYNYMLNLKKQGLDYSQQVRLEALELSGNHHDLMNNMELINEDAKKSARLQEEIDKNEAYLEKLTENAAVTKKADELMSKLEPEEEQPITENVPQKKKPAMNEGRVWRIIVDIAGVLAVLGLIILMLLCLTRIDTGKMGQRKRDCINMLRDGRYIIVASSLICALIFGVVSVAFKKPSEPSAVSARPTVREDLAENDDPTDSSRQSTGEYLTDVEALDEYVYAGIEDGIDGMENIWKYEIATAYGDILNDCVAEDKASLIETYTARAEAARAEAEKKREAASRDLESALAGSEQRLAERMNKYIDLSIEAGNYTFEAEYCENIIALMTVDYVVTTPEAVEKVKADIEAIYDRIDEIINPEAKAKPEPEPEPESETESEPELPPYELYALFGLVVGAVVSKALILIIGRAKLTRRMRDQKTATENSEHGEIMDDTNFRG